MRVLSRKVGGRILLGNPVVASIIAAKGGSARVGIEAPRSVEMLREEPSVGGDQVGPRG
jgi:carbon storage regulator